MPGLAPAVRSVADTLVEQLCRTTDSDAFPVSFDVGDSVGLFVIDVEQSGVFVG